MATQRDVADPEGTALAVMLLRRAGEESSSGPAAVLALVSAAEALAWTLPDELPVAVAVAAGDALARVRTMLAPYANPLALMETAGCA